jgi:hypothetical protein
MTNPKLTKDRIILAIIIAVIADILEFPITGAEATLIGAPEGMFAAFALDCVVMGAMTKILGFHWMFLPTFAVEVVPGLDLLPTWVGCVAYVVSQRKKEQRQAPMPPPHIVIDVQELKSANASPSTTFAVLPPPLLPRATAPEETLASTRAAAECRLKGLHDLRDKNLISQSEYETKRQQILADI